MNKLSWKFRFHNQYEMKKCHKRKSGQRCWGSWCCLVNPSFNGGCRQSKQSSSLWRSLEQTLLCRELVWSQCAHGQCLGQSSAMNPKAVHIEFIIISHAQIIKAKNRLKYKYSCIFFSSLPSYLQMKGAKCLPVAEKVLPMVLHALDRGHCQTGGVFDTVKSTDSCSTLWQSTLCPIALHINI